jgi:hypothetical protein
MLQESYARISGNEISQAELNLYKPNPKPLGKASIWLRIKRNLIPEKYRTYALYPDRIMIT